MARDQETAFTNPEIDCIKNQEITKFLHYFNKMYTPLSLSFSIIRFKD